MLVFSVSLLFAKAQSNYIGPGIAMSFNGSSSSYVDLGDVYNGVNFPITFEAWVYPTSTPNYNPIFASDNSTGNYSGFTVRLDNGIVFFSMGDGTGASPDNRIGVYSSSSIPINRWTHIACVASNANSWFIYINGAQDETISTGNSQATSLVWSSSPAYIGRYNDAYQDSYWEGQIDEMRFWNSARTQDEIRNFMCRKLETASTGLIGYWTSDESYSSSTILDNTFPVEHGDIIGNIEKITSGAPIGDTSVYLYASTFTDDMYISLFSPSGERCGADTITGNPDGIQIYRVDSMPYYTNGLSNTTPFYFGIFCAENNNTAHYSVFYRYKNNNGLFNPDNESDLALMYRMDASESNWLDLNQFQNPLLNRIKVTNQTYRGEYILNLNEAEKTFLNTSIPAPVQLLGTYPNPAKDYFMMEISGAISEGIVELFNLNGELLLQKGFEGSHIKIERESLPAGCYLYNLISNDKLIGKGKIIFQ
jgi:hypothetical protein